MKWETVIGLEVHTQLNTRSKIFSGASTAFGAEPNTQACAVDVALPGVLPVMNRAAVEKALRLGLAVGATINLRSVFARKNYFYPDLPKAYQISQYELPIVAGGTLDILVDGVEKTIRLTRAHLEEDAGKSLHEDFHGATGIDLNRAGTPLLEIVSEPDMRSSAEAVAYAKALHALVRWIDICDGNMQEGSFRCDANVSVRPAGQETFGTRCEIKNLNSFRFLERAIEFEVRRQVALIEDGGKVVQETRLYDPDRDETRSMRSKEDAHDYRYFPDPDLLPLVVTPDMLKSVREQLFNEVGKLPSEWRDEFTTQHKLSMSDAIALTSNDSRTPHIFEGVVRAAHFSGEPLYSAEVTKLCANWMINEYLPRQNEDRAAFPHVAIVEGVSDETMGYLIRLVRKGTISAKVAKDLFDEFWKESRVKNFAVHGGYPERVDELIEERGLRQISDSGALEKMVDDVLAANPQQVADYRGGKEKAFNSLVGQVMKATRGKANPQQLSEILKRKLSQ